MLDGSADLLPDVELSESGINRPWGSPQTFNVRNSTGAGMTLQVDGVEVVTTLTDQDTPPRDPGNQLALTGNALDVVEGPGSGLDADTLDGQDSGAFAASVHSHSGNDITTGTVAEPRIEGSVARDTEIMPTVLANDGSGSGLDADGLDGLDSSAFSPLVHLHDDRYYTETELNTSGAGGAVHWNNLTSVPAGFADGIDNDTAATPGPGLIIDNGQLRVNPFLFREISTLDSAGDVGWHTSAAIGSDGVGLMSYWDVTNQDLMVAHCNDSACDSATLSTLDSGGQVGAYTSVAIGADGLGVISYYDATNADLKVAHCDDTACTGATLSTLDSADDVGSYTSVAIGADGLGVISYYDFSNADLKVAHCGDAVCSSATRTTLDSAGSVGPFNSIALRGDGCLLFRDGFESGGTMAWSTTVP